MRRVRVCTSARWSFRWVTVRRVATLGGFVHRARQLRDTVYACGPLGVNYHGLRLPLVGWKVGVTNGPAVAAVAALGLIDDLWSGPGARFSRPPAQRPDNRCPQARRHPRGRAAGDAASLRSAARRSRRQRAQPTRHATGPCAQGVSGCGRTSGRFRSGSPSCSFPTIFGRWRCSGTRGRMRWRPARLEFREAIRPASPSIAISRRS